MYVRYSRARPLSGFADAAPVPNTLTPTWWGLAAALGVLVAFAFVPIGRKH
jgi:hypothetical protein